LNLEGICSLKYIKNTSYLPVIAVTVTAVTWSEPSIATAVLRANPNTVLSDFELFGFLFESLCTRDMRVYAQANDGDLFHYASFLMVLTGGQFAYQRPDGVWIVSIGCLRE
jgi:hypothetical protein